MISKIDLFYGLEKKIDIGEIFDSKMGINYMHFHGGGTIHEISDILWGINHLHWPINIQIVAEVLKNIKFYLFVEFLVQKYQVCILPYILNGVHHRFRTFLNCFSYIYYMINNIQIHIL